jgi:excinuclease ABC subunit C
LTQNNIENDKFKVCLEYHIGNCKGPCEGHESLDNYQKQVDAIREILKGNFKESMKDFKKLMTDLASNMHFEEAQKIKNKIEVLENYQSRSTVVNPKMNNIDVFSIISDETAAFINFLEISHGSIVRSYTLEIKKKLDETDLELLELGIIELRERFQLLSREIIVPFDVQVGENVKVSINLGGREWVNPQGETKYFNDIQGWRIEKLGAETPNAAPTQPQYAAPAMPAADAFAPATNISESEPDDLPF